ncbi:MAG: 50S ribosomal protein L25 [Gemmatimonadota bacterium]|nr:MAG: 50S ribosomal protein L25 [Gemmatimonadota bacterium]
MLDVVLKAEKRSETGKGFAKSMRRNGKTHAVLYGRGEETVPLAIDSQHLTTLLHSIHGDTALITLQLGSEKSKDRKVIFKEMQRDPVRGDLLHVDLHHISLTENIQLEIPVTLIGTPIGVREKGGIVQHILHKIEVECLPTNIPEHIELNIENLDVGDSIHVENITVEKARVLTEAQRAVVTVVPPTVIKEAVPVEEEKEEEVEEPEVIEKGEAKEEKEKEKEEEGSS